jgi:hypothetical protein
MIAANRVFAIIDADQIQDTTVEAPIFHGNLQDVHFSYIPDEEKERFKCQWRNNRDRGFYRCWKIYYYQFAKPFYEIDSGTICIDNENIENYTLGSLRKNRGGLARCISICRHHFQ